jgi:hypothetical protein
MKSCTKALLASAALLGACQMEFEGSKWHNYRVGIQPQYYDFKNIKTSFKTPNIEDRLNLGVTGGVEAFINVTETTKLKAGSDLRLNLDKMVDRTTGNVAKSCYPPFPQNVSDIGQDYISVIPFIGIGQKMGNLEILAEYGAPYTKWYIETGDNLTSCFRPLQTSEEWILGHSFRLGLRNTNSQQGSPGLYATFETYDGSTLEVDAWSIQFGITF